MVRFSQYLHFECLSSVVSREWPLALTIADGTIGRSVQDVYPYYYVFSDFFWPLSHRCLLACGTGECEEQRGQDARDAQGRDALATKTGLIHGQDARAA